MFKTQFSTARRRLLTTGVGIAAATASGCCLIPPRPQIASKCGRPSSPELAGPEVLEAWQHSARYFDAHTHFFNARDVPVAGFIAKSVAHSIESRELRQLAISLAPVAEAMATIAPSPRDEHLLLCNRSAENNRNARSARDMSDDLDREIDQRREDISNELYKEIIRRESPVRALINDALASARARDGRSLVGEASTFSLDFVRKALRDGGSAQDASMGKLRSSAESSSASNELARLGSMKGMLQFVGYMLAPRHHNLRTYIRRYAEHSPNVPLSGCFASMVDFNYWLDCPSKASHLQDQVLLHEQLAISSGGFLMPLVAYNPWVDIIEADASLKLVERAIVEHGCVGVKIYPPMGFYPYGNENAPLSTREKRPNLVALDKKLSTFYELCDYLQVPVMAHANNSNGRDAAHNTLAGANGWFSVGEKIKTLQLLKLNAGHFGGAHEHASGDWSEDFVRLMQDGGSIRAYADVGYWPELMDNPTVQAKFKRLLQKQLRNGEVVADRVLYGSDWLMLSRERSWESYGEAMSDVLKNLDPTGTVSDKVLGRNALECFGLGGRDVTKNRARLFEYHQVHTGRLPGWATDKISH